MLSRSSPLALLCLLALGPEIANAQTPDPQGGAGRSAWYMYFGDHPVSTNWGLHLEGQYRREGLGQRWEQLLLRPGIDRKLSHGFSGMLAYTYLRDYPFEGGSLGEPTATGPQPEHRILEQLVFRHRLGSGGGDPKHAIELSHRFRAEQRFVGTSTAHVGTTAWQYQERARYRLTADIPFRWNTSGARPDYTSVYNEVFVNFGPHGGTNALDQNRTYGAIGWKLRPHVDLEVGYLYQYQPLPNGVVDMQNHALQITINASVPLRRAVHRQ